MTNPRTIRRYNISDSDMIAAARRFYKRLGRYIHRFTSFDPGVFPVGYDDTVNESIETADKIPSDMVYIDMQASETQDLYNILKWCREEMRFASYFVEKFTQGKNEKYNQFGYNDLTRAHNRPHAMIEVYRDFTSHLEKHSEGILAGNYPLERYERAIELYPLLLKEKDEQEEMKDERTDQKINRIEALNRIWDHMVEANRASDHIFYEEPELRDLFNLPTFESRTESESEPDFVE